MNDTKNKAFEDKFIDKNRANLFLQLYHSSILITTLEILYCHKQVNHIRLLHCIHVNKAISMF